MVTVVGVTAFCVDFLISALVCLSSVWSLHRAAMSGRSKVLLFSRNDLMSNTLPRPVVPGVATADVLAAAFVVAVATAEVCWNGRGMAAAGFCGLATGGGGGGGRRRYCGSTLGGTAGADAAAVNRSSCEEYVLEFRSNRRWLWRRIAKSPTEMEGGNGSIPSRSCSWLGLCPPRLRGLYFKCGGMGGNGGGCFCHWCSRNCLSRS